MIKWGDAVLAYRNINRSVVNGKSKRVVFGTDVWLQSAHRLEVDDVGYMYLGDETFDRRNKTIANEYNPGGVEIGTETLGDNDLVMQMLKRLFKQDDLEQMRSYLRFLKFTPDKPTSYCVLWSNIRGVGKGWFVDLARALIGYHDVSTSTADLLAEKYNLNTVNCRLLIVHEFQASSGANKKAALNYLKNYMGDETITVRAMHRNPYDAEVRSGLLITTNDKYNMPSDGLGDRRQWYIEGGAGLRERDLELWAPESNEWNQVWAALKDPEVMSKVARWVWEGKDVDFKSWRPPVTEDRVEDLMEGQTVSVQIAHEVLRDMRDLGVRVLDPKAIRQLMNEKMEGQELYLIGKAFGKCLKEAGWWTDKKYERATASKSAAWFTLVPPATMEFGPSNTPAMIREDALKIVRKY